METDRLIKFLKGYAKENPNADVLSAGIYDISYFNNDLDEQDKVDTQMWNLIIERAKELKYKK